ncbi:Protein O-glucosyltransferase 2, partial [Galemys pyrenaicus]
PALTEIGGEKRLSPEKSEVWGPGLRAAVVLPARYFYIQAVDTSGQKFTSSPGEKVFQVKISAPDEQFTRVGVQVLDRKDGSFIVRYRMYASYKSLKVEVKFQGQHVAKSPYILQGPVYHENCDCPVRDSAAWLQEMSCPDTIPQIQRDLEQFPTVDLEAIAAEIPKRFGQRQSLCHYTVKDNKIWPWEVPGALGRTVKRLILFQVYVVTHGEHVGFRIFMDAILLSLTRKVKLPDVEFFVNLGDWPLEKKKSSPHSHPIFSWCGSTDSKDIVMPTYDLTDSVLETMGRVSLDMLSVQGNTGPPWGSKNSTAVWRGRDSCRERLELVKLGRKHPDLIDAAFTNFFFFKHNESLYGPVAKHISFFDFFKHKYQINVDGTVAAYRLPYLLVGDSVVLKQDSIYYEHFYNELQPWKHYIPVKSNLSDLLEKLKWAKDHDEEVKSTRRPTTCRCTSPAFTGGDAGGSDAKKIAKAGQEFARNNLMSDDIFCYYFKLFQEYASLQVNEPQIREGMKRVEPQTEDDLFPCTCHREKWGLFTRGDWDKVSLRPQMASRPTAESIAVSSHPNRKLVVQGIVAVPRRAGNWQPLVRVARMLTTGGSWSRIIAASLLKVAISEPSPKLNGASLAFQLIAPFQAAAFQT